VLIVLTGQIACKIEIKKKFKLDAQPLQLDCITHSYEAVPYYVMFTQTKQAQELLN
jgi:hypothetical protein